MKNDDFTQARVGDYVIFCDICGNKCWASSATRLDTYTGRGGLIVCPDDADVIDYGIVPYKLPVEKPVPYAKDTIYSANPAYVAQALTKYDPMNLATEDPLSTPPSQNLNPTWKP